jgi:maltose phosphorylase
MAGTWLSVVKGFGGMRVINDKLSFEPFLPKQWQGFSFRTGFRGNSLNISIKGNTIEIKNIAGDDISVLVYGKEVMMAAKSYTSVTY